MVIKTMKKEYVNLAKYSDFIIRHKQEEFAVIAMEPARKGYEQYAASVELGCYPSETEAQKALEAIMEHWDAIKEAEYYGAENNFRYISNVFTMPEASKNKTEEFQTFTINPSYKWIIGISNSEADGARLYYYEGTVEQIKSQLVSLIREDRENDKSGWGYGSENENDIFDESDGDKKVFSGFGSYSEYHIDYTAEMLTRIEKLND